MSVCLTVEYPCRGWAAAERCRPKSTSIWRRYGVTCFIYYFVFIVKKNQFYLKF